MRYPGGKSRLVKFLLPRIGAVTSFADVCVGGGSVALAVAEYNPKVQLVLNDLHPNVAAFWSVLVQGGTKLERFCRLIQETQVTVPAFEDWQQNEVQDPVQQAFRLLFLNRCSYSGLGGAPIGGWKQAGTYKIGCRWNAERLEHGAQEIHKLLQGRTAVYQGDLLEPRLWKCELTYIDPPYVKAGPTLYFRHDDAKYGGKGIHVRLAEHLRQRSGWVLSYDCEARALYPWANIQEIGASYTLTSKRKAKELVITPT